MNQNNDDVELLDSTPKREVNLPNVNSNTSDSTAPSFSNNTSPFASNSNVAESLENITSITIVSDLENYQLEFKNIAKIAISGPSDEI